MSQTRTSTSLIVLAPARTCCTAFGVLDEARPLPRVGDDPGLTGFDPFGISAWFTNWSMCSALRDAIQRASHP